MHSARSTHGTHKVNIEQAGVKGTVSQCREKNAGDAEGSGEEGAGGRAGLAGWLAQASRARPMRVGGFSAARQRCYCYRCRARCRCAAHHSSREGVLAS